MTGRLVGVIGMALVLTALVVGTAGVALAWEPFGSGSGRVGPGAMMGGSGQGSFGPGSMMGVGAGRGGMMGSGPGYESGGMMPGWVQGIPGQSTISLDQAQKNAQSYVDRIGNADLTLDEVMAFQNNFYAIVKEKGSGEGAFEVLIDKWTGVVTPEPGPNMMWNTKYGMMSGLSLMAQMMGFYQPTGPMSVTTDQATQIAQQWLDQNQSGSTTEKPDQFFGYYTVHTLKDGKVTGMLSVNGYTGQVWYHTWHGTFIQVKDLGA